MRKIEFKIILVKKYILTKKKKKRVGTSIFIFERGFKKGFGPNSPLVTETEERRKEQASYHHG